jgi:hypothetical protein
MDSAGRLSVYTPPKKLRWSRVVEVWAPVLAGSNTSTFCSVTLYPGFFSCSNSNNDNNSEVVMMSEVHFDGGCRGPSGLDGLKLAIGFQCEGLD